MAKARRIFIIADIGYNPIKMFLDQMHKLSKGLIRLGNDARIFSYSGALRQLSPLKSKTFSKHFFKSRLDHLLAEQIKNYKPDVVYISFVRFLNADTIKCIRQVAPKAVFIGGDGDPWPKLQEDRIETAKQLDILTATNDGQFLQDYRDAGVQFCVFMPNMCDPDIDRRYEVGPEWKTDVLWTGKVEHHADTSENFRKELVQRLAELENCSLYGCLGRPKISGMDYLYAISGARIGVNVNAYRSIKFCHSDRLTHYLACGTMVMARRMTNAQSLFKEKEHLVYFDSIEEFFGLSQWYLTHEQQRQKIADAGMQWAHEQFNSVKIAGYVLELVEKGSYSAPWFQNLSTAKMKR